MPSAVIPSDDTAMTALRAFILDVLPALAGSGGVNVQQGQNNDVPMPPGPNFVIFTPSSRMGLATTIRDYTPPVPPIPALGTRLTTRSVRMGVFINFYGPAATDNAQTFNLLFKDLYGCDFLRPYGVQPLDCDDGRQLPLVAGEKDYIARWLVQAYLQINPAVSTAQEFADTVNVELIQAD